MTLYKTLRLHNQQERGINFHGRIIVDHIDISRVLQGMQRQMLKARDGAKFRNQWDIGQSMPRLITHLQLVLILRVLGHLPPFLVYASKA